MEKKLYDNELGTIILKKGSRYTRYTLKVSKGIITATMPERGDESKMLSFISENKSKLITSLEKHPAPDLLDTTTNRQMSTFQLQIICVERNNFKPVLENGLLTIYCPASTHFEDERVQTLLKEIIRNVFRYEAKRCLPGRLAELAQQFHFTYTGVKINSSRTHWGSCTPHKSINLSLSLMLLPWYLIDYVLLHELCHTIEMSHNEHFWSLMNRVTNNQAKQLRAELKKHPIFV